MRLHTNLSGRNYLCAAFAFGLEIGAAGIGSEKLILLPWNAALLSANYRYAHLNIFCKSKIVQIRTRSVVCHYLSTSQTCEVWWQSERYIRYTEISSTILVARVVCHRNHVTRQQHWGLMTIWYEIYNMRREETRTHTLALTHTATQIESWCSNNVPSTQPVLRAMMNGNSTWLYCTQLGVRQSHQCEISSCVSYAIGSYMPWTYI